VNLAWAVDSALTRLDGMGGVDETTLVNTIRNQADQMVGEDVAQNRAIGRFGAALFPNPVGILTHCNTGGLATGGYGTALGIIRSLHTAGRLRTVYVDETRPLLQGARLTAWELQADGIPAAVIVDGAAASLMQAGVVDGVVVGADRIAANGDTANKIGTLMLAIIARHFGLPFIVAAPWSTIDLKAPDGSAIPIEERDPDEVLTMDGRQIAPSGMRARNPAFDVTPADLITAIVTERGVVRPPFAENLARLA
jgi:methylthioribose-1-phosphate isomerase